MGIEGAVACDQRRDEDPEPAFCGAHAYGAARPFQTFPEMLPDVHFQAFHLAQRIKQHPPLRGQGEAGLAVKEGRAAFFFEFREVPAQALMGDEELPRRLGHIIRFGQFQKIMVILKHNRLHGKIAPEGQRLFLARVLFQFEEIVPGVLVASAPRFTACLHLEQVRRLDELGEFLAAEEAGIEVGQPAEEEGAQET